MENLIYILSSITSGVVNKTIIAPLERLKILKQSERYYNKSNYNNSIIKSIKYIYKNEGFNDLYRGNLINIYRILPAYIIKFPLNDHFTKLISKNRNKIKYREKLFIGLLTGLTQVSLTYPLDFLRTRMSLDKTMIKMYNTTLYSYTKYVIINNGYLSLYKGYLSSFLTYPIYVGLQFSIYNELKENNFNIFISGAIAGLIAQTISFPGDVIKRHMQINGINNSKNKYFGLLDCINKIYIKDGIKGFYKGLGVNIIKCIPGASIQFGVYDICKNYGISKLC